ncbi:hypothetical protein [Alcaligenes faecalis]|uniref:Uncharacterized protein n=1 Tax=Alcaligenes faecalis TaxID=511 RepID=A0AAE9KMF0_ALCFA|nr:hypothetical protein [Alcaligenes faecalis]UPL20193.1 hypothetical protein MXF72_12235 [Alcaligenes faecalis]
MDMNELATLLSSAATLLGTGIAGVALYISVKARKDQKVRDSDTLLIEQSENYLSRAFAILASGEGGTTLPSAPSRLEWVSAARMIEEHKKIVPKIILATNKLRIEALQEYWRTRLTHLFLEFNFDVTYFDQTELNGQSIMPISPLSARIIFDFLSWPDTKLDVLDQVNGESLKIPAGYGWMMNAIDANANRTVTRVIRGARLPPDTSN